MLGVSFLVAASFAIGAPAAFAASASSQPPTLLIGGDVGGAENNQVSVFIPPIVTTKYRVGEQTLPMTALSDCIPAGADLDCESFGIENVAAFLNDGNDSFTDSVNLPALVLGQDGNDTLGGSPANDQMEGDLGNDFVYGGGGNDTLTDDGGFGSNGTDQYYGEAGNDHLDGGVLANSGAGADVLDGGVQTDALTYAKRTLPLTITEDGNSNDGQVGEGDNVTGIEILVLGSAGDKAVGDGSPNTLQGRNGNDRLNGGLGKDSLQGGNGNDTLVGAAGPDLLSGGAGLDKADYSVRTQRVTVTIGIGANDGQTGEKDNVLDDVEAVVGGSGPDVLTGEDGANALSGGAGADQLK